MEPDGQKLLLVDDEPDILESLEAMLSSKGYKIVTARNGEECLALMEKERPDLVLLDIMMPRLDGFEVCRRIKDSPATANVPVLLLTAMRETSDKVKGLDAGADDFISKPFKDAEVHARVRAFLRTKRLHDELEENYKKLKELENLRDSLTHMIIHDLKSPLSIVIGNVEIAQDIAGGKNLYAGKTIKDFLSTAQLSSALMMNLINDLLDVSRLEQKKLPLKKAPCDVAALADSCLKDLEPLRIKNNISFNKEYSPGMPQISLDETIIRRVLLNLLTNSLKFSENGGVITVLLRTLPEQNLLECSVQDTGMGIPKQYLKRIFEKFFQGNKMETTRKGQGLGLTFCRMAVETHGGDIWAESELGKGSKFIFRIPIS